MSSTPTTTTSTTTTSQPPNYPSVPPEQITWPFADPASTDVPAPSPDNQTTAAWKDGANDFPLTVSGPASGATLTSPINVVASADPKNKILFMRVYVDQVSVYFTFDTSINTQIFLAPGAHTLTVMAEDQQGNISATPLPVTVSAQAPTTNGQTVISGIQAAPGWQSCGADFPAGSGRAGQLCAAGGGTPQSTLTQNVSSPSMDSNSAEFSMASTGAGTACAGYCNMLYFNPVAGGNNVSNFVYDLYFWIDNPDAPQALEFDLNQAYDDTAMGNPQRWVWGSECNFKGETPGMWDIWDDESGVWRATNVPCNAFPANTWNHLTWTFERVGSQVHYDTLTVNGQAYKVDTYYNNQQGWDLEEIDTAFQMDLDSNGDPYNVWLDKVNLTAN